jgi:hypothetical protein
MSLPLLIIGSMLHQNVQHPLGRKLAVKPVFRQALDSFSALIVDAEDGGKKSEAAP